MSPRRAALSPIGDNPEEYDERAGTGIRDRVTLRRRGWRKSPHGGYVCPSCSAHVTADVHDRAHHDDYHRQNDAESNDWDGVWDEHHRDHVDLEETIRVLSERMVDLNAQVRTLMTILATEHQSLHGRQDDGERDGISGDQGRQDHTRGEAATRCRRRDSGQDTSHLP